MQASLNVFGTPTINGVLHHFQTGGVPRLTGGAGDYTDPRPTS